MINGFQLPTRSTQTAQNSNELYDLFHICCYSTAICGIMLQLCYSIPLEVYQVGEKNWTPVS